MEKITSRWLHAALKIDKPLQILGIPNAYTAIMAEASGAKSLYLSGAAISNQVFGLPDTGLTTMQDVATEVDRITNATSLPLLVDIDTGWGNAIQRAIKLIEKRGASAVHIEDQVEEKRCGHLPKKQLVSKEVMVDRIKACLDARQNSQFAIMARSDAFASEGRQGFLDRLHSYVEAGCDMVFPEALPSIEEYTYICKEIKVPVLANITEFGKTPLFTLSQLKEADVKMALYPLSATRAMNKAALEIISIILETGTQKTLLDKMQTRDELYKFLNYKG